MSNLLDNLTGSHPLMLRELVAEADLCAKRVLKIYTTYARLSKIALICRRSNRFIPRDRVNDIDQVYPRDECMTVAIASLIARMAEGREVTTEGGDVTVTVDDVFASGWVQLGDARYFNWKSGETQNKAPRVIIKRPAPLN